MRIVCMRYCAGIENSLLAVKILLQAICCPFLSNGQVWSLNFCKCFLIENWNIFIVNSWRTSQCTNPSFAKGANFQKFQYLIWTSPAKFYLTETCPLSSLWNFRWSSRLLNFHYMNLNYRIESSTINFSRIKCRWNRMH